MWDMYAWDTRGVWDSCGDCVACADISDCAASLIRADPDTEAMAWVNFAGLVLDFAGAAVLSTGLFIDEEEALSLGLGPYASDEYDEPDDQTRRTKNLALPPVKDRLRQSRRAKLGLFLIAVGIVLQIVANWP